MTCDVHLTAMSMVTKSILLMDRFLGNSNDGCGGMVPQYSRVEPVRRNRQALR